MLRHEASVSSAADASCLSMTAYYELLPEKNNVLIKVEIIP